MRTAKEKAARDCAPAASKNTHYAAQYISEINREHALALRHADKAIEHAKRAGELLIEVKNALPHGEYLPWLAENVTVSPRQAQRYMRAALGKPLPIRAIKSDTVSFLPPRSPVMAHVFFGSVTDDILDAEILMMQESADAPGYFYIAFLSGDVIFTKRPVSEDALDASIKLMLPGRLAGNCPISELNWLSAETDPNFLRKTWGAA